VTLLPWREHPAARAEYLDALSWYEQQQSGLGERVAHELDDGVDFIRAWPESAPHQSWRQRTPVIRRKNVAVFPYGIIYFLRDGEVIVVAYAHEKRPPGYWRQRLQDL
jgi:hypothetical protein